MPPKQKKDAPADGVEIEIEVTKRVFKLRDPADGAEPDDVVHRVSFGESPPVSIGRGEQFATTDAKLAARCATHPLLEEVRS